MFHWYIDFYVPVGIVRDDIVVVVVDVAKRQHITCTVGTFRDRRNINILLISATLYLNQMIFRFDRLIGFFHYLLPPYEYRYTLGHGYAYISFLSPRKTIKTMP